MSQQSPPPVRIKPLDWAQLVKRVEGENYNKPQPVYEFSNGRKFNDSGANGGPYHS